MKVPSLQIPTFSKIMTLIVPLPLPPGPFKISTKLVRWLLYVIHKTNEYLRELPRNRTCKTQHVITGNALNYQAVFTEVLVACATLVHPSGATQTLQPFCSWLVAIKPNFTFRTSHIMDVSHWFLFLGFVCGVCQHKIISSISSHIFYLMYLFF
jgi:hypothetical protein